MTLADEAQRYLAVVAVFRAEGHEPQWRQEVWPERAELSSLLQRAFPNVPRRETWSR